MIVMLLTGPLGDHSEESKEVEVVLGGVVEAVDARFGASELMWWDDDFDSEYGVADLVILLSV